MMKLVVLSCLLAASTASSFLSAYISPYAYSAPYFAPYNYRGPLSLAPGQPANILGVDGRPLDTLDVNLDRSAHFAAKFNAGLHHLKKRSAPLISLPAAPLIGHSPLTYTAPIYSTYPSFSHTSISPYSYSPISPLPYAAYLK